MRQSVWLSLLWLNACFLSSRLSVTTVIRCENTASCPLEWSCEEGLCRAPGYVKPEPDEPARPALVFSSPGDDAVDVLLDGDLFLVTSFDVDEGSMRQSVSLRSALGEVPLNMQATPLKTTWLFRPATPLLPEARYTMVVAAGLMPVSEAAAPSVEAYEFSFTTMGAPDTTAPGPVSNVLIEVNNNTRKLSFANPSDADFAGVLVVRNRTGTAVVATPANGQAFEAGATLGNGVVAGVTSEGTLIDVADSDEAIEYAFFSFDQAGNYGQGTPGPRILSQSVIWCPDETLRYSAASASQFTQALVLSSTQGAGADALQSSPAGAGEQIVDASNYAVGDTLFVRPVVTTELGRVLGVEQSITLTPATRATVSLVESVALGGVATWQFETDGFAEFLVEVDQSAVAGNEEFASLGVTTVALGQVQATFATKGEYRFSVRPVVPGCATPGVATVSAPIRVGSFLYVATPGRGSQSGLDPSNAMASLAAGIAASSAGTELFVASVGDYTESVHLTQNVTISAGYSTDFRTRGDKTVWRSSTAGVPALHLDGASATVSGVSFEGAGTAAAESTTVRVSGTANVQFDNCEFHVGSTLGQRSVALRVDNPLLIRVTGSSFVDSASAGDRVAILSLGGLVTATENTFNGPTNIAGAPGAHWFVDAQQGTLSASNNDVHLGKGARASAIRCADVACMLTGNRIEASGANGDVVAVELEGVSTGRMDANSIHSGGGQATSCTGVRLANVNAYTVSNNLVYGGDCRLARGIQVANGQPLIVYNAVGVGSDNTVGSKSTAFELGAPSYPTAVNNLFFVNQIPSVGRCVEEVSSPGANDFLTMSHNALLGCAILYADEITTDLTSIAAVNALNGLELTDYPTACVPNNTCDSSRYLLNSAPALTLNQVFVDIDGPDNLVHTWTDNDWRLATAATVLTKGGVDTTTLGCGTLEDSATCGSIIFDASDLPRTCVTSVTNCTSVGPFEVD